LSWVELIFLLANQALSEGDGFPKAIERSKRYAMFDNFVPGFDPTAHALLREARAINGPQHLTGLPPECFDSKLAKQIQRFAKATTPPTGA
jgi:hypothetical protein